jgi:hypothetical protein
MKNAVSKLIVVAGLSPFMLALSLPAHIDKAIGLHSTHDGGPAVSKKQVIYEEATFFLDRPFIAQISTPQTRSNPDAREDES